MTEKLWRATHSLAETLRRSSEMANFARKFPRNNSVRDGLSKYLEHLNAEGRHINAEPFRVRQWLGLSLPDRSAEEVPLQELTDWSPIADRVCDASYLLVAWLRSRLPGYPDVPALQLVRGSNYFTDEFSFERVWRFGERSRGYRDSPPSSMIASTLGLDEHDLLHKADELVTGLIDSHEWQSLAVAWEGLTAEARQDLREQKQNLLPRFQSEFVTRNSSDKVLDRHHFREAQLDNAIRDLATNEARRYQEAFADAVKLLELYGDAVLGQLAVHGEPTRLEEPEVLRSYPDRSRRMVDFTFSDQKMIWTGELVRLSDPIVPEVMRVVSMTISMNQADGLKTTARGEVLEGS